MLNINGIIDNKQVKRVNKTIADKLFSQGENIYLLPCNVGIGNFWVSPLVVSKHIQSQSFYIIVDRFEYYWCIDGLGRYASYYIEI